MKGFAAELDDDLKTEFENHPAVKYVGQFSWTPPGGNAVPLHYLPLTHVDVP